MRNCDYLITAIGDNTIAGVTGASVDELKAKTQLETAVSKIMLMQDPVAKQNALNELSDSCIFFVSVVFPAPDGEDKTSIRGLLLFCINQKTF